jgi:hypothetical protein
LWPDVVPRVFDAVMAQIVRITRERLLETAESSEVVLQPEQVMALGPAAYAAGMGPLLGYWIERELLAADPTSSAVLARHLDHGRRRFAKLLAELGSVLDAFERRGVSAILLKGIHTASAYFPDGGTRPLADIDLLVAPGDFDFAGSALEETGFLERRRTTRPFRSEWVPRNAPPQEPSLELNDVDNPWAIDLHCSLDRRYFRGCAVDLSDEIGGHTVRAFVAHPEARCLAQPLLTAFLALHGSYAIHQLQLIRLVELVLIIRRDRARGDLDWNALGRLLERRGAVRFVYPALELAERLAPGTLDPIFRRSLQEAVSERMRRVVKEIHADGTYRLSQRSLEEKLMWARGPLQVVQTVSEFLWPSDERLGLRDRVAIHGRFLPALLRRRIALRSSRTTGE